MRRKAHKGGFTLIELSLSLIFIGILSITVVLLIQNIAAAYRRGLILNQVNTVGMDLVDDMRSSVQNASASAVTRLCELYYDKNDPTGRTNYNNCIADNADSFVSVRKTATATVRTSSGTQNLTDLPVYGAFCTGTYTYVWNSGYYESSGDNIESIDSSNRSINTPAAVIGTKASPTASFVTRYSNFRLIKIYDDERSICVNAMKNQSGSTTVTPYVRKTSYSNAKVSNQFIISASMLSASESGENVLEIMKKNVNSDLVIYDLYLAKPAMSATRKNEFYSGSFIIGTIRGGINIKTAGSSCKPPSDNYSELEYCAINKFNFAMQAGGE